MISPISNVQAHAVTQTSAATQPQGKPEAAAPASTASSVPQDTVTISSSAAAMSKELTETSAQAAKEASAGDMQAKHLQAKEAAEHTA